MTRRTLLLILTPLVVVLGWLGVFGLGYLAATAPAKSGLDGLYGVFATIFGIAMMILTGVVATIAAESLRDVDFDAPVFPKCKEDKPL